jgi:magnesium chelatase family protein
MALAIIYSRASSGMESPLVTVEAHLSYGMPAFNIVGLPAKAVSESKDRIRSAFMNSNLEFPDRRLTVNLAPADLPKDGGRFDLPIALGILAASGQLPMDVLEEYEFVGELALSGELRGIRGALPVVLGAYRAGRQLIVPQQNGVEAALVRKMTVFAARHLLDVCAHLRGDQLLPRCEFQVESLQRNDRDLSDVKGQPHAKRALEIAAAGRHSLLFIGPPGTGKTMLASRLPSILPELNEDDALEVAAVSSISSNGFDAAQWQQIPFRSPHHGSSSAALVGGGRPPRPGEISLAHRGVLFLDELPEFNRHVLDSLREPLESGQITISRAAFHQAFPAAFQFIAAMNPCPCGYAGSARDQCRCSHEQVKRYMGKVSGPLLDRMDMHVEVARLQPDILAQVNQDEMNSSAVVRERVWRARQVQMNRQGKCNYALTVPELDQFASLDGDALAMVNQVMTKFNLSARVYHRMLKLARTIADLADSDVVQRVHVGEALGYRCLDKMKVMT